MYKSVVALIGLLLVPILIGGGAFLILRQTITWKEFLLQLGISVVVVLIGWFIARYAALQSVEHLNGRITRKVAGTQGCCHCHMECDSTDSKGRCTSEHEVCAHAYDYYWDLETTVGTIGVENCSGWDSPPAVWTNARVGEPASRNHLYTNYLKADPESLLRHDHARGLDTVPEYPHLYSVYKVDPVISTGVPIPDGWQDTFRNVNADLGAPKQLDLAVLLTSQPNPTYAQEVEASWLYGPKNSLTIVLGAPDYRTIKWVRVVTISKVEMLKVHLRDQLEGKSVDDPTIPGIIRSNLQADFHRTPMAEFEYLMKVAQPTGGWLFGLYLFDILVCIGLTYWVYAKDVFGDENPWGRRRNPVYGDFNTFDVNRFKKPWWRS